MDMDVSFAVSGVKTWLFLPPIVAFAVSFFASMGGVSGAFLLLPFQISFLHYVSPSVSATNFVYNIVAIPSGVYRYIREGRMAWRLAWVIIIGTIPGVFLGYWLRVRYLPDPKTFKLFVGCVLLYVGVRLVYDIVRRGLKRKALRPEGARCLSDLRQGVGIPVNLPMEAMLQNVSRSLVTTEYEFCGEKYTVGGFKLLCLALIVGIVGGAYGIGGGSIISPFCVALFGLPVYIVAGAALLGTFVSSIAGVVFYSLTPVSAGVSTAPDWPLGLLFGLGGLLGMYCGARLQKFVPQELIKTMLALILIVLGAGYALKFFAG